MTDRLPSGAHPSRPALVRILAPVEVDTSTLVVALTSSLRRRGVRTGTAEARSGIDGASATVLTTGSGARFTLPGALTLEALRARASAFDPNLDLLIVLASAGGGASGGIHTIEVLGAGTHPATPTPDLLTTITSEQLARASGSGGPADDLGLGALIEERLLDGPDDVAALARATELPIESSRRLLERDEVPPPQRPRATGWRRWFGRDRAP